MMTTTNNEITSDTNTLFLMQNSTDTLVDEANLINKKNAYINTNNEIKTIEIVDFNYESNNLDEVFELNNKDLNFLKNKNGKYLI
jgi:hypothetical protein